MDYDLLTCECTQVVNESSSMLRLDQHFSAKTTGFMRFNYDRSVDTQPLSASATDLQQKVSAPVNGELELLHVFNPSLVNELKAGFNRSTDNQYNYSDSGIIYQIAISTGPGPGFVTENYNYSSIYVGNSFSGIDNLTWVHGRHTFKAGVGDPPHSIEPGIRAARKDHVFHGGESRGQCSEESQPDWRLAGQRFAQERLFRLRAGRVQIAARI